eukprot:TRINITY_DN3258_c0_g2_i1.p1 TRINITY_DN3258_c0_g2~~TRINITY_DN3258_c0_g2_i1.p1  ORF type:complete len:554 (-),score=51.26 TRINITY_DN3258_c0_g2_i1:414-2075(-)
MSSLGSGGVGSSGDSYEKSDFASKSEFGARTDLARSDFSKTEFSKSDLEKFDFVKADFAKSTELAASTKGNSTETADTAKESDGEQKEPSLTEAGKAGEFWSTNGSASYGYFKPGVDGRFLIGQTMLKTDILKTRFHRDSMKRVFLDQERFGKEGVLKGAKAGQGCKGDRCPVFNYCYDGFPGIGACMKPNIEDQERAPTRFPENCPLDASCMQELDSLPHEKWISQVFVLHDVYVNVAGQIFNASHFFDHNTCSTDMRFIHAPGRTRVTRFSELVSVIDWFGWNARSNMLDLLPAMVSLDGVMPALRGIPIAYGHRKAHRRSQLEQMQAIGLEDILGIELETWNPQILTGQHLFFAKKLILPLHQRCSRPSRALWSLLRHKYLLPKDGFPMYHSDWMPRSVAPSNSPLTSDDDWVVLIGMKKERNHLLETINLESHMMEIFPRERVKTYYEGALAMPRRKELLNRARLLVALHENVLADMVFMPPGGSILELRPRENADATFHHLAEVCDLKYNLVFCEGRRAEGKRPSSLRVKSVDLVLDILKRLAPKFNT